MEAAGELVCLAKTVIGTLAENFQFDRRVV